MATDRLSGIYGIRCTATNKIYIGSSSDIPARWNQHRSSLQQGTHYNKHLQRAWARYGAGAFIFEVLEVVDPDRLLDREQHWMDKTQCYDQECGYNIAREAGRTTGVEGSGRPPKPIEERAAWNGKIAVRISPDTAALAQRLMLHDWPDVHNVEQLFAYALRRLAGTTDDERR